MSMNMENEVWWIQFGQKDSKTYEQSSVSNEDIFLRS
jgi:hypothetical protein